MVPVMLRRNGGTAADQFHNEFDQMFDRFFGSTGGGQDRLATAGYPVDIREDDDQLVVEAELPGFKKDEIEITLENGVLSISAQRQHADDPKGTSHLRERRFARVQRRFTLPRTVDDQNVHAKYEDGVLTLTLPKRDEVKPRRVSIG